MITGAWAAGSTTGLALAFREAASFAFAASLSFLRSILGFTDAAGKGVAYVAAIGNVGAVVYGGANPAAKFWVVDKSIFLPVIAAVAFSICAIAELAEVLFFAGSVMARVVAGAVLFFGAAFTASVWSSVKSNAELSISAAFC